MMRFSGFGNRRFWVIFVILGAIGAVYYFYFFIVVKNQRENLEQRGFRILNQVEINLKEKLENYQGSVQNYRNQADEIDRISKTLGRDIFRSYEQNRYSEERIREAFHSLNFYIRDKESLIEFVFAKIRLQSNLQQENVESLIRSALKERIHQELVPRSPDGDVDPHYIKIGRPDSGNYYVHAADLMDNLKFDSFFQDLLLQDAAASASGKASAIIFDHDKYNLDADSLYKIHKTYIGSYVHDLRISSTRYKAFVNPVNIYDREYFLIGMTPADQVSMQARQINPLVIIVGVLAIIVVLIALPLFKLGVMSKIERLRQSDIFLAAISIIVISSVFALLWLNLYASYGPERGQTDSDLRKLTGAISASLEEEIKIIGQQLDEYEDSATLRHFNIVDPESKSYPAFNELFTINKHGLIDKYSATSYPYIVADPENSKLDINLNSRKYFTNALSQNNLWKCGNKAFYMEPIYSYTTGLIEAAVSIPCDGYVKALTAPVYSLVDVVLPVGFSYCIIDESGRTLFHSSKNRTLRENFIRECNYNPEIIKAVNHRVGRLLDVNYSAKPQRVYIEPLQTDKLKSPLLIAAMYDKTIKQAKNTSILVISFVFLIGLVLSLLFLSTLIKLNNLKQSRLRFNRFSFYWLLPETKNKKNYLWLTGINLLNVLFMIIFYRQASDILNIVLTLGISILFISLVTYISLINLKFEELFLYIRRKRFFIEATGICLLVLSVLNVVLFGDAFFNICYPLFTFTGIAATFLFKKKADNPGSFNRRHLSGYSFFLVTWVFTIAILPSVILYKLAWEEVSKQELKIVHREAIAAITGRQVRLAEEQLDKRQLAFKTRPDKGAYLNCVNDTEIISECVECSPAAQGRNAAFFDELSKRLNAVMPFNRLTWNNSAMDSAQYYNFVKDNHYYTVYRDFKGENPALLRAALPQFRLPPLNDLNIFYWAIAALLIVELYYLTRFFVNRIIFNYEELELAPIDPKSFKKLADKKNIFLFGAPYSGKTKLIHDYLANFKKEEVGEFNIFNPGPDEIIEQVNVKKLKVVALKDFEYNLHDIAFNDEKLRLLESLLRTDLRIIVSATVALKQIIDVYLSRLEAADEPREKLTLQHSIDRWENLLYGYYSIAYPLHTTIDNKYTAKERLALGDELEHGDYLAGLKSYICDVFKLRRRKKGEITEKYRETIVIKIQEIAESYYYALWNNCSTIEKYVLFDIADDGFVNSKNEPTIKQLLKKGLIIRWKDSLHIMNQSFRNFILTSTPSGEALKMEREAKQKGSWNKFKVVLSLILAGVVVLYVLAEPDFLNKISSIVTAIAALLPAVYTLTRSLVNSGNGEAAPSE